MAKRKDRFDRPNLTIQPGVNSAFPPAPNYDRPQETTMARSTKGPRRPRLRVKAIAAAPRVVHHVHHVVTHRPRVVRPVAPMMRPVAPLVSRFAPPIARPPIGPAAAPPRPPILGGVGPPPGPFTVPQPQMGAPRAPLPGPMAGRPNPFGRRF